MWLPDEVFKGVVAVTPLISIDLVVKNSRNEILLGKRINQPAQGYWFVPGGRVLKGESLSDAFQRLCDIEIGMKFLLSQGSFLGVYEHFYADSVFGQSGLTTHYVVLAYLIQIDNDQLPLVFTQHEQFAWWSLEDVLKSSAVHEYSREYLKRIG